MGSHEEARNALGGVFFEPDDLREQPGEDISALMAEGGILTYVPADAECGHIAHVMDEFGPGCLVESVSWRELDELGIARPPDYESSFPMWIHRKP